MYDEFRTALNIYKFPSQSFWRAFEIVALRKAINYEKVNPPILEIGCGDGEFSKILFNQIEYAIDINPRSVQKAKVKDSFYHNVFCMDARKLEFRDNQFETVFANCVIEHIPDLPIVLNEIIRVLKVNGKFITTVPINLMEEYLYFHSTLYKKYRRKLLHHINLYSKDEWLALFSSAGFSKLSYYPYLSNKQCYLWDKMDFWGTVGINRINLFNFYRLMVHILNKTQYETLNMKIARSLDRYSSDQRENSNNPFCAMVIVGQK